MAAAGLSTAAIGAFKQNYDQLVAGVTGMVRHLLLNSIDYVMSVSEARQLGRKWRESGQQGGCGGYSNQLLLLFLVLHA